MFRLALPVTSRSTISPAVADSSTTFATLIWLVVSVPVLSEQMTVVHPRVSTEGKLRARAVRD